MCIDSAAIMSVEVDIIHLSVVLEYGRITSTYARSTD